MPSMQRNANAKRLYNQQSLLRARGNSRRITLACCGADKTQLLARARDDDSQTFAH